MRGTIFLVSLLLLAGCEKEPSFDDRYEQAAGNIRDRAADIDNQLGQAGNSTDRKRD